MRVLVIDDDVLHVYFIEIPQQTSSDRMFTVKGPAVIKHGISTRSTDEVCTAKIFIARRKIGADLIKFCNHEVAICILFPLLRIIYSVFVNNKLIECVVNIKA